MTRNVVLITMKPVFCEINKTEYFILCDKLGNWYV